MKFMRIFFGAVALTLVLAVSSFAQMGRITGEVRDSNGNPFGELTVKIKSNDFGTTYELKTDKKGEFAQGGLRLGLYTITFISQGTTVYEVEAMVKTGDNPHVFVNFKELIAKDAAAQKKMEEERVKFDDMKTHFDTGVVALTEVRTLNAQIQRTPAAERAPLQGRLEQLQQLAITEFEAAQKMAAEKDPNLHKIQANLAQAYELASRYDDAVGAYQKAIALKPDPGYYLGMGTSYARLGKAAEATAACDGAALIDKVQAATCYRNIGIVYYNANKMGEAVVPLKKATELDPANAQAWYLLGAALVNTMGFKQEGDKVIPILQPGTVEAYQRCIELDPNGVYGQQAKQGLEQLEAMGLGISTKVKAKKR
jgi:tetratricopeptide (TPR) repeat protein